MSEIGNLGLSMSSKVTGQAPLLYCGHPGGFTVMTKISPRGTHTVTANRWTIESAAVSALVQHVYQIQTGYRRKRLPPITSKPYSFPPTSQHPPNAPRQAKI